MRYWVYNAPNTAIKHKNGGGAQLLSALLAFLVFWGAGQQAAQAWDFAGHFVIAALAQSQLTPQTKAESERLLAVLAEAEPGVNAFVPAAAWLDTQSWSGFGLMKNWHIYPQAYPQVDAEHQNLPSDHILAVTTTGIRALQSSQTTDFQKALMLRVVMHTLGDMHQPLHMIEKFSTPASGLLGGASQNLGDQGGYRFILKGKYPHLHAFWDAAGGQYPYLTLQDWQRALPLAAGLRTEFFSSPCDYLPQLPLEPQLQSWAQESYQLAIAEAYRGVLPDTEPTPEYTQRVQQVARNQLICSAQRLAKVLNTAFDHGL